MEDAKKKYAKTISSMDKKLNQISKKFSALVKSKTKQNSAKSESIKKQNRILAISGACGLAVLFVIAGIYGSHQDAKEKARIEYEAAEYQRLVENELNRDYSITFDSLKADASDDDETEISIECKLEEKNGESNEEYSGQKSQFACSNNKIVGNFSNFDDVEIRFDNDSQSSNGIVASFDNDDGKFTVSLKYEPLGSKVWENVGGIDFDKINSNMVSAFTLSLYNKKIDRKVLSEHIKIVVQLSEEDKNLLNTKLIAYKNHVAELEAKAKAEEEAKLKAEQAATAKKAAEEAAKKKATSGNSGSNSPSNSNSSGSSGGSSASSSDIISGYCEDGTYVTGNPHAKGRANACYGHGGWVMNH